MNFSGFRCTLTGLSTGNLPVETPNLRDSKVNILLIFIYFFNDPHNLPAIAHELLKLPLGRA